MRSKTWLLSLVACASVALVGWMILRLEPAAAPGLRAGADSATRQPPVTAPALQELEEAARRPEIEGGSTASPAAKSAATPEATPATGAITLIATFVRPDHSKLEVERAHVDLIDAAGKVRGADAQHASRIEIPGVAAGTYVLRADAPGYVHREQTIDATHQDERGNRDPNGAFSQARVVLWPEDWAAVLVQTNDGRPFSALAEEFGLEPAKLFAGAFRVRTRLDAPARGETPDANDASLAKFHPPPDAKAWEVTKGCVGSLHLQRPPPMWVGLDLFGANLGWELLSPGDREVLFRLDLSALEACFARLSLRVVDATSRSPVTQALVTLRADDSARRRKDQANVPTGENGRVELARIVPGGYELEIFRGESEHQEMIELRPGERRDLGDVPLGNAAGFDVLVVDPSGNPATAWVEIGPYRKGARNGDIYPQMLRHESDGQGRCRLPMPADPAILRAAVVDWRSNGPHAAQEVEGVRSANVFLDPRAVPPAPIRLRMANPSRVKLTTSRPEGTRFEVLDELDVVVARSVGPDEKKLEIELVPGRYRVRGIGRDGLPGPDVPFSVDRDPATIALD